MSTAVAPRSGPPFFGYVHKISNYLPTRFSLFKVYLKRSQNELISYFKSIYTHSVGRYNTVQTYELFTLLCTRKRKLLFCGRIKQTAAIHGRFVIIRQIYELRRYPNLIN